MHELLNSMKETKFMESEIYKRMDFYYIAISKITKCFNTMKFKNNEIEKLPMMIDNLVYSVKTLDMESRLSMNVFDTIKKIFTLSQLENCVLAKKVSDISKLMDEEINTFDYKGIDLEDSIKSFRSLLLSDPSDVPSKTLIESINILLILTSKIKNYIHTYYTTELLVLNYLTKLIILGRMDHQKQENVV